MGERHIYHANSNELSNGNPKQPTPTRIGSGEIAINYKEGYETMFIKNDGDGIVSFSNDGLKTDINANVTIPTVSDDVDVASTSVVTIGKNVRNTEESITIDCGAKSEGAVYITSVNGDNEHEVQLATHEQLVDGLSEKQDVLESGVNIKTVNGHSLVGGGAVEIEIPEKVSDLTNDSNYQTLTQVEALIAAELAKFDKLDYKIVTTLPAEGEKGVRYLIKHQTDDRYEEYIYIEGQWYDVGATDEVNLSDYYTKQEADLLYDEKVNTDDKATTSTYGLVKLNPDGSVTLNEHGQLVVKGLLGQFPGGGLYYPADSEPTNVGNYSLLISEAKKLSAAHRNFIIAGGTNFNLKTAAQAGATQYRIPNRQDNRFFCCALFNGRLALSEAGAKTLTVPITSVKFAKTGENVYPYHGNGTENDNDIVITVGQTLNPDSTISMVRGYGRWNSADTMSLGQGNAAATGKLMQIGQANVAATDGGMSGTQNLMVGIRNYSTATSSIMVGATNINKQTFSCTIGQGHNNTNGRSGIVLFGNWSVPTTQTVLAIGDGSGPDDRKNIFEITTGNDNETGIVFRAPNGNKYKLSVDNNGNLVTVGV